MGGMPTTEDILSSIEDRLRELNGEIDALAAVRTALDGHELETPRRAGNVTREGARATGTALRWQGAKRSRRR
jgi:hypothetical protein